MTIQEAIDRVDTLKPNKYDDQKKVAWLSEIDSLIWRELYLTHEGLEEGATFNGYDDSTSMDTALLVPSPYTDIYIYYLSAQIDLWNAELTKYANDKTLYNNAYLTYTDWYNKQHQPKARVQHFVF